MVKGKLFKIHTIGVTKRQSVRSRGYPICWLLCVCLLLIAQKVVALDNLTMKAGRVTLDGPSGGATFTTVNLTNTYTNPVVFVLPTNQGPDPASVRIRNVGANSFDIGIVESPGEDGPNPGMTVDYLVVESGTHTLPGGILLEAGVVNTTLMQSKFIATGWFNLAFANVYPATPVALLQVQTVANEPAISPSIPSSPWIVATARNITTTGMQLALERAEDTSGTVASNESIGYLIIQSATTGAFTDAGLNLINYETIRSANNIQGWTNGCFNTNFVTVFGANPIALAHQATRNGGDGGWMRRCNLSTTQIGLTVDEDRAVDTDRAHTNETASIMLFSQAFNATLGSLVFEANSVVVPAAGPVTGNFTSVNFGATSFASAPLVFPLPTNEGVAPAAMRFRNITTSGFEVAAVEPTNESGPHQSMTIDYVAIEPGSHTLPDGTILEAGSISTALYQAGIGGSTGWVTHNFTNTFNTVPSVLLQVQSDNSETINPSNVSVPWLVATGRNITTTNMQMALERAEAIAGTVSAETIGYLAADSAVQGTFLDDAGSAVSFETIRSASNIVGWDDGCVTTNFVNTYGSSPITVAHQATRNGGNGGWLRRCSLSSSAVGLVVDEDRANDTERAHIAEIGSIFAFSQAFDLCLKPRITFQKTASTSTDPVNVSNPKAIPGAEILYTITATNDRSGTADAGTVTVTDPIPAGTELFIGDLDGGGSPIIFSGGVGANASGLTYNFIAINSAADDLEFSNNGAVDFNYQPIPGTYDSTITHIRINPTGPFNPANVGQTPTFQIQFQIRVR